ncbi:MAG: 2-phosphosulfolactate phosphatase [Bythopirellula sp.]|nr:2-phosphosulfolactate phosphatase [Bythopirellula sp.]
MPRLFAHNLPSDVPASELAGSTVIVIDMLRASSTICHALAAGAKCVVPLLEVEETLQLAEQLGRQYVVLGGERGGKIIDEFDLGNSPSEYKPERVAGKMVLFTTTNGTRALAHAREAAHVLVGAVVNCTSIANAAREAERVDILCAGTDGEVTGEDILAAGAIVDSLLRDSNAQAWQLNEPAKTALHEWQQLVAQATASGRPLSEELTAALRDTAGGKNLLEIGHAADLVICAQLDSLSVVPELNRTTRQITLR